MLLMSNICVYFCSLRQEVLLILWWMFADSNSGSFTEFWRRPTAVRWRSLYSRQCLGLWQELRRFM